MFGREHLIYFGVMLLLGAIAVGLRQVGETYAVDLLDTVTFLFIGGVGLLVSGAVVAGARAALRDRDTPGRSTSAD